MKGSRLVRRPRGNNLLSISARFHLTHWREAAPSFHHVVQRCFPRPIPLVRSSKHRVQTTVPYRSSLNSSSVRVEQPYAHCETTSCTSLAAAAKGAGQKQHVCFPLDQFCAIQSLREVPTNCEEPLVRQENGIMTTNG